jgi:hypothetical protein
MPREVKFLNLKSSFSRTKRCVLIAKRSSTRLNCLDEGLIETCGNFHPTKPAFREFATRDTCSKPLNLFTCHRHLTA